MDCCASPVIDGGLGQLLCKKRATAVRVAIVIQEYGVLILLMSLSSLHSVMGYYTGNHSTPSPIATYPRSPRSLMSANGTPPSVINS
jgi:hypothetical protein